MTKSQITKLIGTKNAQLLSKDMDNEVLGTVTVDGKEFSVTRSGRYQALGGEGARISCSGAPRYNACRYWCVHKEMVRVQAKGLEVEVKVSKIGKAFYAAQAKAAPQLFGARRRLARGA
jgi:hypothetical protein